MHTWTAVSCTSRSCRAASPGSIRARTNRLYRRPTTSRQSRSVRASWSRVLKRSHIGWAISRVPNSPCLRAQCNRARMGSTCFTCWSTGSDVRVTSSELPGVLVIEPQIYRDRRGFFLEAYNAERYRACGIPGPFVQDNHTRSIAGTVRGLHLRLRRPQAKLIRVIEGEVFDVAVDVRRGSPTFGRWMSVMLSAENFKQCYVPAGFAHGFCVLSAVA